MKHFMPCQGSVLTKHSSETAECLEASQSGYPDPLGHISKDCKRSYMFCGSHLEVVSTSDGQRITSWCYGRGSMSGQHHQAFAAAGSGAGAAAEILCAQAVDDSASRLLLGLGVPTDAAGSGQQHHGLVCLFDVALGKVIRAAKLPYPVTAVSPVTLHFTGCNGRLAPVECWKQSIASGSDGSLACFCGIAAVGTEHGGTYLLDLCLDDGEAWGSCELTPLCCHIIFPSQDEASSLTELRRQCNGSGTALAICLLDPRQGRYNYMRPDDQVIKCLDSGRAAITCVKFIPEMASLCVGFAFGCFQLWNMSPIALDYSSRYEEDVAPVVAFTRQVPEDDPRNFCYLWVVRCPGKVLDQSSEDTSYMVLYQLEYASRSVEEEYGWTTFLELSTVAPRCEHRLVPHQDRPKDYQSSWFVGCHTLPDESKVPSNCYQHDNSDSETRVYGNSRNSGLCLFAWCIQHDGDTSTEPYLTYHFAIFDINRWYHAQMPQTVRLAPGDEVCSFFSQYSFDGDPGWCTTSCLDIMADISTISRYAYPVGMAYEQVPYPSTLRFTTIFLFRDCHVKAVFLGLQGQIIEDVVRAGPSILLQPHTMHRQLVEARLALPSRTGVDAELREEMLSILLQHGHVEFVMSCVRQWSTGGASGRVGCDLKFLLHWTWSQAARLKAAFDSSAMLLFDCTGVPLDEITARQLSDYCRQLGQLEEVLSCMQDLKDVPGSMPVMTDIGSQELAVKVDVLSLIVLYTRVILWCNMAGMLPEQLPSAAGSSHWLAVLRRAYDDERSELAQRSTLQALRPICNYGVGGEGMLMIDGLVALCGEPLSSLWLPPGSDSSAHPYPPSDVHSMVAMLLLKSCELHLKCAIFSYFVLDFISVCAVDQQNELLATCASDITSMLALPEAKANLIAGFWLLDHDHVEECMERLCDPVVVACMEPWQIGRVVTRLLSQGHCAEALRIARLRQTCGSRDEALPLVMGALLANGCIHEAFHLLREENSRQAHPEKVAALFGILFDECFRKRQLSKLLSLPLTASEEEFLTSYLTRHSRPDLVVMHLLQHARIDDALRLDNNVRMPERATDVYSRERSAACSTILDWYVRTMPAIRQRIVSHTNSRLHPHPRQRKEQPTRPVPFSAVTIRADRRRTVATMQSSAAGAPSRSLLVDILAQISELHEHEWRHRGVAAAADGSGFVSSGEMLSDAPPSPLPLPFQQTPVNMRYSSRLTPRPSHVPVDASARDEASTSMISLKRPHSPTAFSLQHRETPSPKHIRLHAAMSSAIGDQAWSLLQTPAIHRKTPPSQVQPNNAGTPALKLASLFTPQSILKTRIPAGIVTAAESPAVTTSLSAEAESTSTALTSTAKKGVSFVGLAASPGGMSNDSPIPESKDEAVPEETGVKNRRMTTIMPAAGLKPLREFGLLLSTPPRYDHNSTSKAAEPAAEPPTREMEVQPLCILFDDDEDDDDSQEMLSADDTLFPGLESHDAAASVPVLVQQQSQQASATTRDTAVTVSDDDDEYALDNSSGSSVAAATGQVCAPTEAAATGQPLNLVSGYSDDATSAAASEVPLESCTSSSSLTTAECVTEDHLVLHPVSDQAAAGRAENHISMTADSQQAATAEGEVAAEHVRLQPKGCNSDGQPDELTCSRGASGDFEPQQLSRTAMPGDSHAFPGALQSPLNDLAMSSGLELRKRLETLARMEAAASAAARDRASAGTVAAAAIDAVSATSPATVCTPVYDPAQKRDAAVESAQPGHSPVQAQSQLLDTPDAVPVKSAERVSVPDVEMASSATEVDARITERAEPVAREDGSSTVVSAADVDGIPEVVDSLSDAGGSKDAAVFLFSPPQPVVCHPALESRQQQRRASTRPFTFAAPSLSTADAEPHSSSRRSSRPSAAALRFDSGPAAAADATPSAAGHAESEPSSDAAASTASSSRRSLRPRSSFKQDTVGAVGVLLEQDGSQQVPTTAAASAPEVRRARRTTSGSRAAPAGDGSTPVAAAGDRAARRGGARSRPRSQQPSGDDDGAGSVSVKLPPPSRQSAVTPDSSDRRASAAEDGRTLGTAERAPLPPLLEDSTTDDGGEHLQTRDTRGNDGAGGRAGLRSREKQPTARMLSDAGKEGDGAGHVATVATSVLPPPSPFRDVRRRLRNSGVPEQASAVSDQAEGARAPAQLDPAQSVTPSQPPAAYAVQSQRSSRSRVAKPQPPSHTPINFTPVADSSVQKSRSANRRAAAVQSLVQTSASPLNMTLRSRSSKK